MYAEYETPQIAADILYYDETYEAYFAEKVLRCLEANNMFFPERINLGGLSKNRFKQYTPEMRELFVRAYSEKDVLAISWESKDSRIHKDYVFGNWTLTFNKKKHMVGTPTFRPWNVLSLNATYDWIEVENNCDGFFRCIKQLIPILHPFCIEIDDVSNLVSIHHAAKKESLLKPRHLHKPNICWGNYWGADVCSRFDVSKLSKLSLDTFEEISGGVYFTLSDHVLHFDASECIKSRKNIKKTVLGE